MNQQPLDMNHEKINQAKETLKNAGYQVDNLWHIDDVLIQYDCDKDTAMEILEYALSSPVTTEQVFMAIEWECDKLEIEEKTKENGYY